MRITRLEMAEDRASAVFCRFFEQHTGSGCRIQTLDFGRCPARRPQSQVHICGAGMLVDRWWRVQSKAKQKIVLGLIESWQLEFIDGGLVGACTQSQHTPHSRDESANYGAPVY